jgi:homoserine O-acetyltransferase
MVEAQRRMLVEGLGVRKLRLLIGTSMGCMHGFVWAQAHPGFRADDDADGVPSDRNSRPQPDVAQGRDRGHPRGSGLGGRQLPGAADGGPAHCVSILQVAGFAPLYLQKTYPTRETADPTCSIASPAIADARR